MPTRKQIDAVLERIVSLTEDRFLTHGEFLRPVGRDSPQAGTPWKDLDFEDRREAVYVNTDWSGFTLEEQMEVTDRVADGDPVDLWMGDIRASDQREHDRALFAEQAEEKQSAGIREGRNSLRAIMAGEIPAIDKTADAPERDHER